MLTRIALLIIIVASATVCGLSLTKIKQRTLQLQREVAMQTQLRADAGAQLASAKAALGQSEANLKHTQMHLKLATAQLQDRTDKLEVKARELQSLRSDMDAAQAALSKQSQKIKTLEGELVEAKATAGGLAGELEKLKGTWLTDRLGLPADFQSNVVAVDPKWHFVVLDAGKSKGVFECAELLVTRNGQLIGKLQIKSVQKYTCIANILPGWDLAEVKEGDVVFPLRSDL